ncbi:MarR family transcriptional regulator [Winkia neuii]|uniref:MarR family transcriptional regulator n=1 Tax=Winkia sp. ACRQY TaxID=2918182 RepID=UPI000B2DC041|nr:MarR family transcriptional regulator [Winkia sp. UMB1185]NJJ16272.1 MarR family transcriptional regulator [Winkia neuii]
MADNFSLWHQLGSVFRKVDDVLDLELSALGLSLQDVQLLYSLKQAPQWRLRMSDLADSVALTRSGVTRAVSRLVKRSLVCRQVCPKDQRAMYAVMTSEGDDALAGAMEIVEPVLQKYFFDGLSKMDERAIMRVMEQVSVLLADSKACQQAEVR